MKIIIETGAKEMAEFLHEIAESRPEDNHVVDIEKFTQDLQKAFSSTLSEKGRIPWKM